MVGLHSSKFSTYKETSDKSREWALFVRLWYICILVLYKALLKSDFAYMDIYRLSSWYSVGMNVLRSHLLLRVFSPSTIMAY